MLSDRRLRVFVGEKSSSFRTINNGLPQGSVLLPLLFNLYMYDIPQTSSSKFIYAVDIALLFQSQNFQEIEQSLSSDLVIPNKFFNNWRLSPNCSKTEVSCFHLCNSDKKRELRVSFNGTFLRHNSNPTYLGVKLDTSLTYKFQIEKLVQKLKTRVNLIQKLAGT